MAVPPRIQARGVIAALAGMLLVTASPATAEPITTPLSRFDVELPASWTIGTVKSFGPGLGGQYLNNLDRRFGAIILVHAPMMDCMAPLVLGAGEAPYGRDWLPAGWAGKVDAKKMATLCSTRAGFPILLKGEFGQSRVSLLELLGAFDRAWKSSPAAKLFEVVRLPGTGLVLTLPDPPLRIVDASPITGDTVELDGPGGTAKFRLFSSPLACDAAFAKLFDALGSDGDGDDEEAENAAWVDKLTPGTAPAPTGWRRWELGSKGHVAYCSTTGSPTAIVLSPGPAAIKRTGIADPSERVLDALHAELVAVEPARPIETLAVSKWRVHVPGDWKIATAPEADGLIDGSSSHAIVVMRGTTACEQLVADSADTMRFDPAWLPAGWRAAVMKDSLAIVMCSDVEGGTVQAVIPPLKMPRRRELVAVLASLRQDNLAGPSAVPPAPTVAIAPTVATAPTTAEPATTVASSPPAGTTYRASRPHRPVLPFPLHVSYQTVGLGGERGHGVRIGAARSYGDEDLSASVHGELGYDTLTKLGHDIQLRASVGITGPLSLVGSFGHDAWGDREDLAAIPSGWYGGLGGTFRKELDAGVVTLEGHHLWRSSDPDRETRLGASFARWSGTIMGLTGELRWTGDATTILIGTHLRL